MVSMRDEASKSYASKMGRMGLATGGNGKGSKMSTASMGEDEGNGHAMPDTDGSQGMNSGAYATGYATESANEDMVAEKRGKPRLDRKGFRHGGRVKKGGTTVNVIVAPQAPKPPMLPMPPPGAGPGLPMPPPDAGLPMPPADASGPMPGGMPGGGMMPRKHGGRVPKKDEDGDAHDADDRKKRARGGAVSATPPKMKDGAGGGLGRLEKIKEYGANAKP